MARPRRSGSSDLTTAGTGTQDPYVENGPPFTDLQPEPRIGDVVDFGFVYLGVPIHIISRLDPSRGYAVQSVSSYISQAEPLTAFKLVLWGVPADSSHTPLRFGANGEPVPANVPRQGLLSNPTHCGSPLSTKLVANSWQQPALWQEVLSVASPIAGCNRLTFEPAISVKADTERADSPVGLAVDVSVPQDESPDGLATPHLRRAVVRLPQGLAVNPSSADGLGSCSEAEIGLGQNGKSNCPDAPSSAPSRSRPRSSTTR